jgi:hypothetical protein
LASSVDVRSESRTPRLINYSVAPSGLAFCDLLRTEYSVKRTQPSSGLSRLSARHSSIVSRLSSLGANWTLKFLGIATEALLNWL